MSISGFLKRAWIPLLLVAVLAVSALAVTRLHKVFASQDLNANSGAGIKIVQFNPKVVKYDILGPPGSTATLTTGTPTRTPTRSTTRRCRGRTRFLRRCPQ